MPGTRVPSAVALDFFDPIIRIGLWHAGATSAVVAVPETAMNEDHPATARENQIRFAGKVFPMQAIAVAPSVEEAPNGELR
jgi:hypothetical protein